MSILGQLSWMQWFVSVIDALLLFGGGVWLAILQPSKVEEKIAASNFSFEQVHAEREKYSRYRWRGAILMTIGGVRLIYRLFIQ